MEYRTEIEEYLVDTICDDADDMIDFVDARYGLEEHVAIKISQLTNDELIATYGDYITHISIDDLISEIESEED